MYDSKIKSYEWLIDNFKKKSSKLANVRQNLTTLKAQFNKLIMRFQAALPTYQKRLSTPSFKWTSLRQPALVKA